MSRQFAFKMSSVRSQEDVNLNITYNTNNNNNSARNNSSNLVNNNVSSNTSFNNDRAGLIPNSSYNNRMNIPYSMHAGNQSDAYYSTTNMRESSIGAGPGIYEPDSRSIQSTPSRVSKFTYSGNLLEFLQVEFRDFIFELFFRISANKTYESAVHKHGYNKDSHVGGVACQHGQHGKQTSKVQSEDATSYQRLALGQRSGFAALLSDWNYSRRSGVQSADQIRRRFHRRRAQAEQASLSPLSHLVLLRRFLDHVRLLHDGHLAKNQRLVAF